MITALIVSYLILNLDILAFLCAQMNSLFGSEQIFVSIQMDYNMNIATEIQLTNIHVLLKI